ncbi:MAG TPA: polymer-forming cytoskeletal protein [Nitrospirota bacterium]|nr:polymer-forming cytoskeletal protein [Nitrospirota bacterium]
MLRKAKGHPEVEEMVAFLGKGTDFRGVLHFEGTIRVDGRLEGEVFTKDTLIVGDSAEIVGNVNVGTLISSGRINGNIIAAKTAHLMAPGSLTGDIITPTLKVDEGFSLNGRCEMKRDKVAGRIEPAREEALTA